MTVTITLPDEIAVPLEREAVAQQRSPAEVALAILSAALEPQHDQVADVVARIKQLPAHPENVRSATGSLADALRHAPNDPAFDLAQWNADWAAAEAELRAATRANDVAEGRA